VQHRQHSIGDLKILLAQPMLEIAEKQLVAHFVDTSFQFSKNSRQRRQISAIFAACPMPG
jgi:hypothetical protein